MTEQIPKWQEFHNYWIDLAKRKHLDLFILFYEDLKNDLERSLSNLGYFLGVPLSRKTFLCIQNNVEGSHHRGTIKDDPFEKLPNFSEEMRRIQEQLNTRLAVCQRENMCITSGSWEQPLQILS